ncbi:helix-turn-helix transcriptional regulator [Streptomyces sp. NPDC001941]|uniref:helix-turn-helix transcriptional regulator n=1 Tax=Streptomyces sp. NPDC001941 TaxID=3154659 RepID=UPI003331CF12
MAPGHVAYGLRAQYGLQVSPDTVTAWERGLSSPDTRELTALAGVLWCDTAELLGAATTLREHRMARGTAPEEVARRVGLDPAAYRRMEETGRWRGNERQTAALARALDLTPRAVLAVTGRDGELAELLRDAVGTRWQAYVKPVAKLVPLERPHLEAVLQRLHGDYQALMVATSSWGSSGGSDGERGREFLDDVAGHFWRLADPQA